MLKNCLKSCREQKYDVILLDISLPEEVVLDLITQIKKTQQSASILLLSIHSEEMYAIKALKLGASGYLTKSSAPEELLAAIFKLSKGERYISSSLADKLADNLFSESEKPPHLSLSAREQEVLNHFADGKTVVQIASELSLSPKTISTYRVRLLKKLKLNTTADLIRYAIMERISGQK